MLTKRQLVFLLVISVIVWLLMVTYGWATPRSWQTNEVWMSHQFWLFLLLGVWSNLEIYHGYVLVIIWEIFDKLVGYPKSASKIATNIVTSSLGYSVGFGLRQICW